MLFVSFHSDQLLLLLAFCEFSFGADIIIITDPPGGKDGGKDGGKGSAARYLRRAAGFFL